MMRRDAPLADDSIRSAGPGLIRVLLVAPATQHALAGVMEPEGWRTSVADLGDHEAALAAAPVDVVLLDAAAPGIDLADLFAPIARSGGAATIVIGAPDEDARVAALDAGAWSCPPATCGPRELAAIVRAAARARRPGEAAPRRRYLFAGWRLDVLAHELTDPDGSLVTLTDGEFAVLRSLVERPRRVLSRETLLEAARGGGSDAFDRAVDTQISRIRRKLRASGDELIRTVRNEGYLFVPPVTAG